MNLRANSNSVETPNLQRLDENLKRARGMAITSVLYGTPSAEKICMDAYREATDAYYNARPEPWKKRFPGVSMGERAEGEQ